MRENIKVVLSVLSMSLYMQGCATASTTASTTDSSKNNYIIKNRTVSSKVSGLTWENTGGYVNGKDQPKIFYNEAYNRCNTFSLNGFTDWRLPTKNEAYELWNKIYKDKHNPFKSIPKVSGLPPEMWIGTYRNDNKFSPGVYRFSWRYLSKGSAVSTKDKKSYALCVRGKQIDKSDIKPDLIIKSNSVIDTTNNVMWADIKMNKSGSYKKAYNTCKNLVLGGYRDWRLPTTLEYKSMYPKDISAMKYPIQHNSETYWTGTDATTTGNEKVHVVRYGYQKFKLVYDGIDMAGKYYDKSNGLWRNNARCVRGKAPNTKFISTEKVGAINNAFAKNVAKNNETKRKIREKNYNTSYSTTNHKYKCSFYCEGQWGARRSSKFEVSTPATNSSDAIDYVRKAYKSTCKSYPFYSSGQGSATVGYPDCN